MENKEIFENRMDLTSVKESIDKIKAEISKVVVGQESMIDLMISALLANGHILIEGFPGLAKTLSSKLLARTLATNFSRIQFTPDLMPSDVLGTSVFNFKDSSFQFKKGPIFSNIILIDEINRAPAKTQSALFEVMEERQVTIDGKRYMMDAPFLIIATQNPIDMEGTYRLPEAQMDRFMYKIEVDYPNAEEEIQILELFHKNLNTNDLTSVNAVLSSEDLAAHQQLVKEVHVDEHLIQLIVEIVQRTRAYKDIMIGASPRASLAILAGAKAFAVMKGRDFVTPDDILEVAIPVLNHRVSITPEKEMEGSSVQRILELLIKGVDIPR